MFILRDQLHVLELEPVPERFHKGSSVLSHPGGTADLRVEHLGIFPTAGNVVTGEMVEELIISGADIIKVGVGPGSVCTTRTKTGVGYPQLSAVIECGDSAHGLKGHIISVSLRASPGEARSLAATHTTCACCGWHPVGLGMSWACSRQWHSAKAPALLPSYCSEGGGHVC
ncbi:inosine-5'-monophosphate dehydrogenase-like isoform X2 [Manis pentadactyla]|uniref:inosine-5'-monophosphate dehydrogenase-like isoform X2 n=1 Tax=Manis pentadactyla TaxID=143292 RepID=UPI00255D0659|nr:inosine-5'-monophosphate dehydrogenase-like isoform X2 [Manis pentadactyla]